MFQFKAKHNRKGPWEFGQLKMIQDLGDHTVSTIKPVLSGHLKIDKTKVLKANRSLMKAESISEWSPWSTFDLH